MEAFYPGDHLVIQVTDSTLDFDLDELVSKAFTETFPSVTTTIIKVPGGSGVSKIKILAVYRDCATPGARPARDPSSRPTPRPPMPG